MNLGYPRFSSFVLAAAMGDSEAQKTTLSYHLSFISMALLALCCFLIFIYITAKSCNCLLFLPALKLSFNPWCKILVVKKYME